MYLYNNQTKNNWLVDMEDKDGNSIPISKRLIESAILDVISCENLIVLAGLGTSLHVRGSDLELLAPTMWKLWEQSTTRCDQSDTPIEDVLDIVNYHPESGKENIETLLSKCKIALDFLVDTEAKKLVEGFVVKAERKIHSMCNFVTPDIELGIHSDFLRRVARRNNKKIRTKIFTTNYDKCFESAGGQNGFVVIDGFSHSLPQVFDSGYFDYDLVRRENFSDVANYIENVFQLYKVHGSVDWNRSDSGKIVKMENPPNPIMVFPRHNKYELAFEPPYLEMMGAFQSALRRPNTGLLVIGFGFNDNHISEPIVSAIKSNLNLKVVVCDPSLMAASDGCPLGANAAEENHNLRRIKKLVDLGDPRISFINSTFENLVPVVPDMVAEDEREKHLHRIQRLQYSAERQ